MQPVSGVVWALTVAGIVGLLLFDFFFHVRKAHVPKLREAALWTSIYVSIAILFGAGVWIFGGGILRQQATLVATDGTPSPGPLPETKPVLGGFSILEVPSRDDALAWAARLAQACRCPQEVREIAYDPES